MVPEDLVRVGELEHLLFPVDPWPSDVFPVASVQPGVLCQVVESDGVVVGYLVTLGTRSVHIANIAVAPDCQRQGVGSCLMRAVEEHATGMGAALLELEVRESNTAALGFYEHHRFVITGRQPGYYGGEDAILMARAVRPDCA